MGTNYRAHDRSGSRQAGWPIRAAVVAMGLLTGLGIGEGLIALGEQSANASPAGHSMVASRGPI